MQLGDLFDLSLVGRRDTVALEYDGPDGATHALTFGDIDARANRMAHALAARGLVRGDRLCVHLANRVDFLDLFLACVRMGVIFVPVNVLYREREIGHIVADAAPRFSITSAEHRVLFGTAEVVDIEEISVAAKRQADERVRLAIDGLRGRLSDDILDIDHRAVAEQREMLGRRDAESRRGIGNHVPDLALAVQHVHGHEDHAQAHAREEQVEEVDAVREVDAEPIAADDPACRQRMGHAVRARVDVAERQRVRDTVGAVVLERDGVAPADEREIEEIAELHARGW